MTTYDRWTFGIFSESALGFLLNDCFPEKSRYVALRTAEVTEQIKAPVFPKEVSITLQDIQRCQQPNVLEFLLFWLAAARDPTRSLVSLPSDPVVPHIEAFFSN